MGVKRAILGDIMGSQYEFPRMRPKNLDWQNVPLISQKCKRTDDTILTLATKGAILEGKRKDKEPNFAKWYHAMGNNYKCGYGSMFRQWLACDQPQPYNSFGNGSAMRISFIGEHYDNIEDVIKFAKQSAVVTHSHPEGVKGAIITATSEFIAKETKDKNEIYKFALRYYGNPSMYDYPLVMSLTDMRKIYKWDETCQGSVPAAIRCVLEANSYEEFIRNVMSLPCDMDTLGAIGGGIAEELFGFGDIDAEGILEQFLEPNLFDLVIKEN